MRRTKRIFISDLHLGSADSAAPSSGHPYSVFGSEDDQQELVAFFRYLLGRNDLRELILLGDIFDLWNCPVDVEPPTIDDVIGAAHNDAVVDALRSLCSAEHIEVLYLPGNHDMQVTAQDIARLFPGMRYGGSALRNSAFRVGRVFASHGSAYGMFNAPDPSNDPGAQLPLGYYLTRLAATKHNRTGDDSRGYFGYVDDLLEVLGPSKLAQCVVEAAREDAGLAADVSIKMRAIGATERSVSAEQISTCYSDLYDQWKSTRGSGRAFKGVLAEIGMLGPTADGLCKSSDTNVVIFGHTHKWELDKDSLLVADRVYANCGAWCEQGRPRTFVELDRDGGKRTVSVCRWRTDEQHKVEVLAGEEL
jgi:UDP-2,3-diacylglucosamine pyrophosphatase LpxH